MHRVTLDQATADALLIDPKTLPRIRESRRNFGAFVGHVGTDENGRPLPRGFATDAIGRTLAACHKAGRHVAIVAPPGLGKSVLGRLFLVWLIGRNPSRRVVAIQADEGAAIDTVSLCRSIVVSTAYRDVFPEVIPDSHGDRESLRGWAKSAWFLKRPTGAQAKDPTMVAVSATPRREDLRADVLLADDIITERIASSKAESDRVVSSFFNTWLEGRLSNGGWCLYLANLRRRGDLSHTLRDDPRFCSLWIGVVPELDGLFARLWNPPDGLGEDLARDDATLIEAPGDGAEVEFTAPLPRRAGWSANELASRNPAALRQLYRLIAVSPDDAVFPSFAGSRRDATAAALLGLTTTPAGAPVPDDQTLLAAGLDWSSGKRHGKALTLVARKGNGPVVPVFHTRIGGSVSAVVERLDALWASGLRWSVLMAESNATQDELNEAVRLLASGSPWQHTVVDFLTVAGAKGDLTNGLPGLDVRMQTGGFLFPTAEGWRGLEDELTTFDRASLGRPGKTPDGIMSLWFAVRGLDRLTATTASFPLRAVGASDSAKVLCRF